MVVIGGNINRPVQAARERERSQGLARKAGAVYAHARRAGGINSTLDGVTRIILSKGKGTRSFSCLRRGWVWAKPRIKA